MIAKDPADRYQTPAEVVAALEGCRPLPAQKPVAKPPKAVQTIGDESSMPQPKASSRRSFPIAPLVLLALLPLIYFYGAFVIRYATNKGVLVVEVDDKNVEVLVKDASGVVLHDKSTDRLFTLAPTDGQIEVYESDSNLRLLTKEFSLTRGDKKYVRVTPTELADNRGRADSELVNAENTEFQRLRGQWLATSAMAAGKTVTEQNLGDFIVDFLSEDRVRVGDATKPSEFTYEINPNAKPATIDLRPRNDKQKSVVRGVYELTDDELLLAMPWDGSDRPRRLASVAGDRHQLIQLQRVELTEDRLKELVSAAAGIKLDQMNVLANTPAGSRPKIDAFDNKTLTALLLSIDPRKEAEQNPDAAIDFRFITEKLPKPAEMARTLMRVPSRGYASFIQPEYITDLNMKVIDDTARGEVAFEKADLFQGRVEYVARRDGLRWRITELRMPNLGIRTRRDKDGNWSPLAESVRPQEPPVELTLEQTLKGHSGLGMSTASLATTADGKRLISAGGKDKTARLWDTESGKTLFVMPMENDGPVSVAITDDGKLAAVRGTNGHIDLWDIVEKKKTRSLDQTEIRGGAMAFSTDGKRLITGALPSGDYQRLSIVWDVETGERLHVHRFPFDEPVGAIVAVPGTDDVVFTAKRYWRWNTANGNLAPLANWPESLGGDLDISSDGAVAAIVTNETVSLQPVRKRCSVQLRNLKTGRLIKTLETNDLKLSQVPMPKMPISVCFLSGDELVAVGYMHGEMRVFEIESGRLVAHKKKILSAPNLVALTQGRIASTGLSLERKDNGIRVWQSPVIVGPDVDAVGR